MTRKSARAKMRKKHGDNWSNKSSAKAEYAKLLGRSARKPRKTRAPRSTKKVTPTGKYTIEFSPDFGPSAQKKKFCKEVAQGVKRGLDPVDAAVESSIPFLVAMKKDGTTVIYAHPHED